MGYLIGSFPWCMFSLLLREAKLPFEVSRILGPILVTIMGIRAILGPSFMIKITFAMTYLFDFDLVSRDQLGKAFEKPKVKLLAYHFSFGFGMGCLILTSFVAASYAGWAMLFGLLIGLLYGDASTFYYCYCYCYCCYYSK